MTRRAKKFLSRCIAYVMLCTLVSSILPLTAHAAEVGENEETSLKFVMKFVNAEDTVLKVGQNFKDEGVVIVDETGKTQFSIRYEDGESVVRNGDNKIVEFESDLRVVVEGDISKEGELILTYKCGGYSLKKKVPVRKNVRDYKAKEDTTTAKEVEMTFTASLCGAENLVKLVGKEFVDQGISVSDRNGRRYGAFESLFKTSGKVNSDKQGEYKLKYTFGKVNFQRTVNYVNAEQTIEISLFMSLLGDKEVYLQTEEAYEDIGAVLMDGNGNILFSWARNNDGNTIVKDANGNELTGLEAEFGITSNVVRRKGETVVTQGYQFAGASVKRTIHISSTANEAEAKEAEKGDAQELSFIFAIFGNKHMKLKEGERFVEPGYSVFGLDGSEYASLVQSVSVAGEVMENKAGEYEVQYTLVSTLSRFVSVSEDTVIIEDSQDTTDDSTSWTPPSTGDTPSIPTPTPPPEDEGTTPTPPTPAPPDNIGDGEQKPAEPNGPEAPVEPEAPIEPEEPVAPPDNVGEGDQKPAAPSGTGGTLLDNVGQPGAPAPVPPPPNNVGEGSHPGAVSAT